MTSGGHHWRPVQTCSLEALPVHIYRHLVVATYGWQAGAMHPSGMRSCHRSQGKVMFSEVSTGMLSCYRPQGRGVVVATATVGTHPTGMHSRCNFFFYLTELRRFLLPIKALIFFRIDTKYSCVFLEIPIRFPVLKHLNCSITLVIVGYSKPNNMYQGKTKLIKGMGQNSSTVSTASR